MVSAIVIFDIDGVIRDVGGSYRRALADTVEHFTAGAYRPSQEDIDDLKAEGIWNNDWEASQELIRRYFQDQEEGQPELAYAAIVAFFQSRYRGPDPERWTGYICDEPLLVKPAYFAALEAAGLQWGFFSGATRGSASYVVESRLGLQPPVLIAMEDAPGKPDPTGLLDAVRQCRDRINPVSTLAVIYAGDTVADIRTVVNARSVQPDITWIAVGILPPHVQDRDAHRISYTDRLHQAGAAVVFDHIEQLTPEQIQRLIISQQSIG
ncbi:TIGR01548 family HAD-type hydrolase [Leptolyngbya sp. 'hensonii']|uniref:TIGR01548 family HAD-type hydrolase n=1 Tax=Leptolyngbya sp. 'hensonii' TaxID=1922337 RepID=UPI000A8FEE65|nr:TIGR01548 family HAD-type hydrolase [Leptolyngbya sp. 'hensonii']